MTATLGLALLAGILSTLSPCVLPLIPLILGAALSEHKLGPAALAVGLALSFTTVGLFVATIGFAVGLDAGIFRSAAAILMVAVGIVLVMPRLQVSSRSRFGSAWQLGGKPLRWHRQGRLVGTVLRRSSARHRLGAVRRPDPWCSIGFGRERPEPG